jgi:hypothetical protein
LSKGRVALAANLDSYPASQNPVPIPVLTPVKVGSPKMPAPRAHNGKRWTFFCGSFALLVARVAEVPREYHYRVDVLHREPALSDTGSLGVNGIRGELDRRPLRRYQGGRPCSANWALRLKRARNIPRQLVQVLLHFRMGAARVHHHSPSQSIVAMHEKAGGAVEPAGVSAVSVR